MKILKAKIDMKKIQYLNIFEKITRIKTMYCFEYNSSIIFAIPAYLISKAIGIKGINVKRLSRTINRKVRIVAIPSVPSDIATFIETIIYPVKFKKITVESEKIIIRAGPQSKALIIGRNRIRLNNLKDILEKYFGIVHLIIK
jgi:NusA-like KH domain protein